MNTDNIDLSKPDAAAQKLAPELAAGYKTFSAATWALRLWKWVVRPVGRIAVGTLRGVWWLLKNGQWKMARYQVYDQNSRTWRH
ncbi:hypothetical protein [Bordetella sp. FB-8]|uniref:hypothetical protein n=1 Tax=Bordetella sp. FB-8 TaxID=1159870 RepID=UPI0003604B0D|nr:hypothetical protein [Bordetella sp. FB-8]